MSELLVREHYEEKWRASNLFINCPAFSFLNIKLSQRQLHMTTWAGATENITDKSNVKSCPRGRVVATVVHFHHAGGHAQDLDTFKKIMTAGWLQQGPKWIVGYYYLYLDIYFFISMFEDFSLTIYSTFTNVDDLINLTWWWWQQMF